MLNFKIIREKFYKNFKKENNLDYNFLEVTKNNMEILLYN